MLNECGCEEEDHSIYGDTMYIPKYNSNDLYSAAQNNDPHDAPCPDTYQKVADTICQNPHDVLQSIRPVMQQMGVGCPQSFAKALSDIFSIAQDMGVIKSFNTEY